MNNTNQSASILCVDLDGTLIRTNLLFESTLALLHQNPFYLFVLPIWLLRGMSYLKNAIAGRVDIDVIHLPYNIKILDYITQRSSNGTQLILCAVSHHKFAQKIADHLGCFAQILTTDNNYHSKGAQKSKILCENFGAGKFDYIGKSKKDIPIWKKANRAILVGPNIGLEKALVKNKIPFEKINVSQPNVKDYLRALRPHQWVKNFLLFVPLLAGHQITNVNLLLNNIIAFTVFCLAAASIYLINDLLDLQADRNHPSKRNRPFASGTVSLTYGLIAAPLLVISSLAIAFWLPLEFLLALLLYCITTIAYSLILKKYVIIDVMVLAGLYTLRILAGGGATGITPSFWLLAFAMFLFLSLALAKRNAELLILQSMGEQATQRRQYEVTDLPALMMLGMSSGLISVLVLALYINSEQVQLQYPNPEIIWLLCPLMLFWITRLWLKTSRGELHEDPVVYALSDRASQLVGLICILVIIFAIR